MTVPTASVLYRENRAGVFVMGTDNRAHFRAVTVLSRTTDRTAVTGVVIALNEADRIARCVASLRALCVRVVVLDSGSHDDTVAVARAAGAEVLYQDWLGFSGAAQRLKDRQADVTFVTAGWPTAAITELATTSDITLVPLDDETIAKIIKEFPFYAKVVIPAGTYKGVDVDTPTITTMAQWVVDGAISEEMVYNLTKALWEKGAFVLRKKGDQAAEAPSGAEIMAQAHVKGKDVTLNTALNGVAIPLHPGALKFYREKGLK